MSKNFSAMEDSNASANPSIHEVSDPSRRRVLQGGLGIDGGRAAGAALGPGLARRLRVDRTG